MSLSDIAAVTRNANDEQIKALAAKGGVIFSTCGGTVNFIGGTISGNAATGSDGGVVNMAGGTITIPAR